MSMRWVRVSSVVLSTFLVSLVASGSASAQQYRYQNHSHPHHCAPQYPVYGYSGYNTYGSNGYNTLYRPNLIYPSYGISNGYRSNYGGYGIQQPALGGYGMGGFPIGGSYGGAGAFPRGGSYGGGTGFSLYIGR